MIVCPACEHENLPGTLYCEDCAEPLHNGAGLLPEVVEHYLDSLTDDRSWGVLSSEGSYWIMIQPEMFYNQRRRLVKTRLVLGRMESSEDFTTIKLDTPEIDRQGVSRLHAALVPLEHGVGVQDIGSTNGTRLNGERLAEGRIYNLADRDRIELGKFALQVYFVDQIRFLRAIRSSLVKQFPEDVQELLEDMDIPTEALGILLERLPEMGTAQLQVLTLFKEQDEPVTLEHLHERINRAMGNVGISTRPASLDGETTHALQDNAIQDLPEADRERIRAAARKHRETSSLNAVTERTATLLSRLHADGVKMEARLREYLEEAERLPTDVERQEVVNLVTPILIQMNTWLPTIAPAKNGRE